MHACSSARDTSREHARAPQAPHQVSRNCPNSSLLRVLRARAQALSDLPGHGACHSVRRQCMRLRRASSGVGEGAAAKAARPHRSLRSLSNSRNTSSAESRAADSGALGLSLPSASVSSARSTRPSPAGHRISTGDLQPSISQLVTHERTFQPMSGRPPAEPADGEVGHSVHVKM